MFDKQPGQRGNCNRQHNGQREGDLGPARQNLAYKQVFIGDGPEPNVDPPSDGRNRVPEWIFR